MRQTFVNAALISSAGAFRPPHAGCNHAASPAALFQHRAAVAHQACRRHELLRDQAPHRHRRTFVRRPIDRALDSFGFQPLDRVPHMVHGLRRVRGGVVVLHLKVDPCRQCERDAHIRILTPAGGYDQWFAVVGFAHFRCQFQPLNGFLFFVHPFLHFDSRACSQGDVIPVGGNDLCLLLHYRYNNLHPLLGRGG